MFWRCHPKEDNQSYPEEANFLEDLVNAMGIVTVSTLLIVLLANYSPIH